jgi:hypothetical protein
MSISDFEKLIKKIKLEVQENNLNAVLENIITVANEARKANKSGFNLMQRFIRAEKTR